ncbi:MAG: heme/hemin ABC transporter substrate-binding protein [Phyllobacterium sp.]
MLGAVGLGLWLLPAAAEELPAALPDTSRLVSIGDSITEIVFALGEQERLVARDSTSTYPQAANALPDIGYMRALSPEGVLSVNPTAIIAVEGSGPVETLDVLKKASVPFVFVPQSYDAESVTQKVRIVGAALGKSKKADELAKIVEREIAAAQNLTQNISPKIRVLFILSAQGGKLLSSGAGTAANGIIGLAGGVNAIEGFDGYKQLSDEAIIAAQPDVILMMDRGGDQSATDKELLNHPAIANTPVGQTGKIIRLDGQYLLGFGPRTGQAAHTLAVALYGDRI